MEQKISITVNDVALRASLQDTPTARAIVEALPLSGFVTRWGGEVYFTIPVDVPLEPDSREVLQPAELGYWPMGNAFCIFFGVTPLSEGEEIRAASPVNIFGTLDDDWSPLENVRTGAGITITSAPP